MGKRPIREISEKDIQEMVLHWQKNEDRCLKKSTVHNFVTLINQIFKYAEKIGIIENKKMDIQFVRSGYPVKEKVFTKEEQDRLIRAILDHLNYRTMGILLCLNCGLRIGEICALKWGDFDFETGCISISKTIQRVYNALENPKTKIIISSPKTSSSNRVIPLSDRMLEILSVLGKSKNCKEFEKENYVLTNQPFYLEPRNYRKFYMNFMQKNNLPQRNFHSLRHTFATRCIELGGDYKTVSVILGHSTINTTLNMYVHPRLEEKRKCIELLSW